MRQYARDNWSLNLDSPEATWNFAKSVHDSLEDLIQGSTIFATPDEQKVRVSFLDLVAYSYIKEELVNTSDSAIVKYLMDSCPKVIRFVEFFDQLLASADSVSLE